jgi:glycosyltransferase involved in cell wall biosynthesis
MLTVVMPTYNGAGTLGRVLATFSHLDPPHGGWKLLVVDNGSTDSTKDIIRSFEWRLPLTYLYEPRLGKSTALNTGLRHTSGDLVVFTDDDVLPKVDWLVQMRKAADSQPSFSIFGGAIIAHWELSPEPWILKWQYTFSITDAAWEEGMLPATRIYGPNMAVRSHIIEAGYRFDTSLGPAGRRYRMGEDTDFLQRISKAGFRAWHCKSAVVAHIIRRDQMTKRWVLERALPLGGAEYRRELRDEPSSPALLLGTPRYLIREVLTQAFRCLVVSVTQKDLSFEERWRLHYLVGRVVEARKLHDENSLPPATA